MTKKSEKTNEKPPAKDTAEKLILYEAVQKHPEKNYILVGALSKAGLLEEYKYQKANFPKFT